MSFSYLKAICSLFMALFSIISLQAMEEQNHRAYELFNTKESELTTDFVEKSTDEDVIKVFKKLINKKIDTIQLEEPKSLLDGIVQLNKLFRNLEVNLNESDSSFLTNGLLVNGAEIPSHPLFNFWMQGALKSVFEKNEKVKNLIEFVVEKLAKNVTEDNKERCITLVDQYLPSIIAKEVTTKFAHTYGWNDMAGLCQKTIEIAGYHNVFPIDATRIAITCKDIQIWNPSNLKCEKQFTGDERYISAVAYNHKNILASVAKVLTHHDPKLKENPIKIWDLNSGKCLKILDGHTSPIFNLKFMDDITLISTNWNTIKVWDIVTGSCLQTFEEPNRILGIIKLDENTVVFSSENKITTLNVHSGQSKTIFEAQLIDSLIPLKNNKFITISCETFKLWNAQTGECLKTFKNHSGWIRNIISIDDDTLASSANDKAIKIWCLKTGKCKKTLYGHQSAVNKIKAINNNIIVSASFFSPNDTPCIDDYDKQTVKIWNINTGECLQTFDFYSGSALPHGYLVVTDKAFVTPIRNLTQDDLGIIDLPTFEQTINFLAKKNSKKEFNTIESNNPKNTSCAIC